jgi:hypothetical protein
VSRTKIEPKSYSPDQARKAYFPTVGRAAFYDYIRRGLIPHIPLGRKIVIPRSSIEKFFDTCGGKVA